MQTNTLGYNFGITKPLESTGSTFQLNFNNARNTSNSSSLATSFTPSLNAIWTQPLLKNFKIDANRHQIQIAKKQLDLSDAQFRQQTIQIIATVQQAYWNLALTVRQEEIQRDALKLAETQLKNNQTQVEVGTLAPIDVVTASTQVKTVRQQVSQAMQAVGKAEDAIKALTVAGPDDALWQQTIRPVESCELRPLALTLNDAVKLALTNRSEIRAYGLQKEMNDVDVKYLRNQAKPQVDLVTSYGVVGAGGSVAYFPDQNGVLQPANVAPDFIGGYGTPLGNLAKNSFPTWRVGVNISLPLRNRTAQANLGHAFETHRQIETQTRKELQAIEVEVRTAYRAAEVARMRSACGAPVCRRATLGRAGKICGGAFDDLSGADATERFSAGARCGSANPDRLQQGAGGSATCPCHHAH